MVEADLLPGGRNMAAAAVTHVVAGWCHVLVAAGTQHALQGGMIHGRFRPGRFEVMTGRALKIEMTCRLGFQVTGPAILELESRMLDVDRPPTVG